MLTVFALLLFFEFSDLSNVEEIINKSLNYAEKKLGYYPFEKIIISTKNKSRRPIYGLNNIPKIISPFEQSFLFEFNVIVSALYT